MSTLLKLSRTLSRLVLGGLLGLTAHLPASHGQVRLPDIGDASRSVLSAGDERAMGDAFLREIRAYLPLLEDIEVVSFVRSMGDRLVAAGDTHNRSFRFVVVNANQVNAFAGPGGIIGVNTGLIALSRNESELASVMAHEIAHVTQNHLSRALEASARTGPLALAGLLAGLVLATQNAQAGQAAVASVLAGSVQSRLDFTRQNEKEADRVGTALLAEANYDPRAMPTFFEHLQQSNRYYSEPPEFLSTHPVTVSRIAESRARAEQFPYKQYVDSIDYQLVRAKVIALSKSKPTEAIEHFEAQLRSGLHASEDAARYGLAVALMQAKRWGEAMPHVEWLLARYPDRIPLLAAWADVMRHTGQADKARTIYQETLKIYPTDTLMTEKYAELLLLEKRPAQALPVLETYGRHGEPTAIIHELTARALSGVGHNLEANAALAEAYVARGDLDAAIHQLGIALRQHVRDHYAAERAQARMEQLQVVQRERAKGL